MSKISNAQEVESLGPDRTAEHMVVRAAERMGELERDNERLRGWVTRILRGDAAAVATEVGEQLANRGEQLRVYDASHRVDQILSSAWIFERRSERCHVAFVRDAGGVIDGIGLYVEAK